MPNAILSRYDASLKGADVKSLPSHPPAVMHPANNPGEQCQLCDGIQ